MLGEFVSADFMTIQWCPKSTLPKDWSTFHRFPNPWVGPAAFASTSEHGWGYFYPLTFRVFSCVAIFIRIGACLCVHVQYVFTCITACDLSSVFKNLCTVKPISIRGKGINMQQLAAEWAAHPDSFNRFGGQSTAALTCICWGGVCGLCSHSPGRGSKCWILHKEYLMRISCWPGDQTNPDTEWVGSFLSFFYHGVFIINMRCFSLKLTKLHFQHHPPFLSLTCCWRRLHSYHGNLSLDAGLRWDIYPRRLQH